MAIEEARSRSASQKNCMPSITTSASTAITKLIHSAPRRRSARRAAVRSSALLNAEGVERGLWRGIGIIPRDEYTSSRAAVARRFTSCYISLTG